MPRFLLWPVLALALAQCRPAPTSTRAATTTAPAPFDWRNATVYFLLTDRFANGDTTNDVHFGRTQPTGPLRGFMGGDLRGVIQKLEEGYFDSLGVDALWLTPLVEQIHGAVDEGTGNTYGYHGYWAGDWTRLDPNFGTMAELGELVAAAHARRIRVLLDVVANHTGPVTPQDPAWPDGWVRQGPVCSYKDYETTVACTLVENLPDLRTDRRQPVELPPPLREKWQREGRLERETADLEAFFTRTGYPPAPRYYLIKWLTDYVRRYGIDGFRVDTAKHTEADLWQELKQQANQAFADWKAAHPAEVLDTNGFFTVGEVYGYDAANGRSYDYGDRQVDFYGHGFTALINFGFKYEAQGDYAPLFEKYDGLLHGPLAGLDVLNYLTSHDDGDPFDATRTRALEAGTKLLLSPGAAQIYYGDETARPLRAAGATGDAHLRTFMNWNEVATNPATRAVLHHWQRLGTFRRQHPAVGAGRHRPLQASPYTFARTYQQGNYQDRVVVALNLPAGTHALPANAVFADGTRLRDHYAHQTLTVRNGVVTVTGPAAVVLLAAE